MQRRDAKGTAEPPVRQGVLMIRDAEASSPQTYKAAYMQTRCDARYDRDAPGYIMNLPSLEEALYPPPETWSRKKLFERNNPIRNAAFMEP